MLRTPWQNPIRRRRPRSLYGNLIALIRKRLDDAPDDLRLRQSLARHLGHAGRYQEAIEEVTKVLDKDPRSPEAKRLLLGLRLHRFFRQGLGLG